MYHVDALNSTYVFIIAAFLITRCPISVKIFDTLLFLWPLSSIDIIIHTNSNIDIIIHTNSNIDIIIHTNSSIDIIIHKNKAVVQLCLST